MKVTELILELRKLHEKHGDLDVSILWDWKELVIENFSATNSYPFYRIDLKFPARIIIHVKEE